MSQTYLSLHAHIIFHTSDNRQIIREEWRNELHAFIGGCLSTARCVPEAIGGTDDHVHILVGFRATHCLAGIVKDVKVASSKWVHQQLGQQLFGWQGGYCAISVSPSQIERVKRYIANQVEHHRTKSFEEEYVQFLKAAGVEYEEKYLFT
jgi:putative transposase